MNLIDMDTTASPPVARKHPRRLTAAQLADKITELEQRIGTTEQVIDRAAAAQRKAAAAALLDDDDAEAIAEQQSQAKVEADAQSHVAALKLALIEGRRLHAEAVEREREEKFVQVKPLAAARIVAAKSVDGAIRELGRVLATYKGAVEAMRPFHAIDPQRLPAVVLRGDIRTAYAMRHGLSSDARSFLGDALALAATLSPGAARSLEENDNVALKAILNLKVEN